MGSNSSRPEVYTSESYAWINLFLGLTTVAIVARAVSRHLQRADFGFDDGFAWAAYISNTIALVIENTLIAMGVMNLERYTHFSAADFKSFKDRNHTDSFMYLITMASAKLSVLFLCRRIFGMYRPWFRFLWWLNLVLIIPIWTGATLGLIIWAQVTKLTYGNVPAAYSTAGVSLVNVLSDLLILVLPVGGVLRLQLSSIRKLGIIAIFSLGLITSCISLARLIVEFRQAAGGPIHWNAAYTNYNFTMLSYAETSAATLCACTPVVRKFVAKIGEIASRNMSLGSLRHLVSRSSKTDLSAKSEKNTESTEKDTNGKFTVSRTIAVDVESIEDPSGSQSHERSIVLGFVPRQESMAHVTGGA